MAQVCRKSHESLRLINEMSMSENAKYVFNPKCMIPECEKVRWKVSRRVLRVFMIDDVEVFTLLVSIFFSWLIKPCTFNREL